MDRGRPVETVELARAFWGDARPPMWRAQVGDVAQQIATTCADKVPELELRTTGDLLELRAPMETWVDVEAAVEAVHEAEGALRTGRPRDAFGPSAIAHHISRRPFLPGETSEWVTSQRQKLLSVHLRALEARGAVFLWNGEASLAVDAAKEVISLEPLRETGYQLLMKGLAAVGNAAEAIRVYEHCRVVLQRDLGAKPSAQTRAVYEDLLDSPERDDTARRSGGPPPHSSTEYGRYRVEAELGRGGMAVVYTARDVQHDRLVALKVLEQDVTESVAAERFAAEIAVAARLAHPHILPVFDSGCANGRLYYVMPLIEGESLGARLRRLGQLDLHEATHITIQVAGALDYAHRQGVIHRDVKPDNILLLDGHAMLADFGLAKALQGSDERALTRTGLIVGTPTYMSPEQVGGDAQIDGRSDIYSLGCVLYEMLSGQPPFAGETPQAQMWRRMVSPPASLDTIRSDLPPHVVLAVRRATSVDPEERFASARELGAALREEIPRR